MTTTAETTDMQSLLAFARDRGACAEARDWLATQTDPRTAWETCERPDWMIWYARRRNVERKVLVRIACDCARTALRFVPEGEDRPRLAIEAAERWTLGEATIDEVRAAAAAAAAVAYAADAAADAAAAAAYAAAYAAIAAAAAAAAAAYVADAVAAAAAYVADAAADAAAYVADAVADVAADAAAAAAYAADAAAAAAAYVADAADAAAAAAADVDVAAYARKQANIQMCQIIRTHLRYEDVAL